MKNSIFTILLLLLAGISFAQDTKYELPTRQTPTAKKEKLAQAKLVTDLSPLLWSSMRLSSNDRYFLEHRRIEELPQPANYIFPQERYKQTIDYIFVKISTTSNGKSLSAQSNSDELTSEQKAILNNANYGAEIKVTIKYKYKDKNSDKYGKRNEVVQGSSLITVIPEVEAEYPGGWKQLSIYFEGSVLDKISNKKDSEKILQASLKFIVNENGEVVNTKIAQTSTDFKIDKLILDAMARMPKWKPAYNSKGVKVKQEINIPFGGYGC